ncbi:coiled-coil domain-containing protein 177 isoform X2 [Callorhinchus milii]|uniref:coiled-coil domain-containing protein 177 isoform X2 n=1 Tax=Callorhinchus milii TaxID=7868 RepID=UPI000457199D|nr:coiled-coil domain-containing protein 177 isoform X2 [Callorhinchus milii]|eukprot:gi/632951570/ref/XP_007891375.1/ PREDICTED: coiled-coil domain-containing protein 177 isoform X2 [Callorhinchus milii]
MQVLQAGQRMVDNAENGEGAKPSAVVDGAVGGKEASSQKDLETGISNARDESPLFHLDLENFDTAEAEGSRYVLTSPRSLEACARCRVRPVELLHRSVNEFAKEAPARSMYVAAGLYEMYEKERRGKLRQCREEREKIIRDERRGRKACHLVRNSLPCSPAPGAKKPAGEVELSRCKSHSLESLKKKKEVHPTTTSNTNTTIMASSDSGASSSFSGDTWRDHKARWLKSSPRGKMVAAAAGAHLVMSKSFSLGDLSHSPQTIQKVARIVNEVKLRSHAEVTERDRKIAALMLAKHQGETIMSDQSYQAHLHWDSHKQREVSRREREERERQQALLHCHKLWDAKLEDRRHRLSQDLMEVVAFKQHQVQVQEEKWRHLAGGQERLRREKLEKAKLETREKKKHQEQQLRSKEEEIKMLVESKDKLWHQKLIVADHKKMERERSQQREKREANKVEKLKHEAMIKEVTKEEQMEKKLIKDCLEQKLSRCQENYEQLMERRNRELRERAAREEQQLQRARGVAEQREKEHREHLETLAKAADKKLKHAAQVAQDRIHQKSRQAVQSRTEKEKLHRQNKLKLEQGQESKRKEIQQSIAKKAEKSERIFRERQVALENSRSLARASFHIRDRVREEINNRTFDKMVLEAELQAQLDKK